MRGMTWRRDSGVDSRVRFCKSATGGLRHFSADARDNLSRRFNGEDSRVRFCKSATGDLRHFSAGGRICRRDSTAQITAFCFTEARPAACSIFQRADGFVAEIQRRRLVTSSFAEAQPRNSVFEQWYCNLTISMMFLEKMGRFFSIFPVISASKPMKMAKTEFHEAQPTTCGIFQRTRGRICREDSTARTAASSFAEMRPATCAIFQRAGEIIYRGDSTA